MFLTFPLGQLPCCGYILVGSWVVFCCVSEHCTAARGTSMCGLIKKAILEQYLITDSRV